MALARCANQLSLLRAALSATLIESRWASLAPRPAKTSRSVLLGAAWGAASVVDPIESVKPGAAARTANSLGGRLEGLVAPGAVLASLSALSGHAVMRLRLTVF